MPVAAPVVAIARAPVGADTALRAGALRALTVLLLVMAVASPASAQPFDHMKCYKIKDQKTFKSAQASLEALQSQFGVAGCTIKPRAKTFCVPVHKDVTALVDGTPVPLVGDEQAFDSLCYKIKCPKTSIAAQLVTDQFGTRDVDKLKPSVLCTPAILGTAPTTTTTTITIPPLPPCMGGSWPGCGGDCTYLGASYFCDPRDGMTCACVLPCNMLNPSLGDVCATGGCAVDSRCEQVTPTNCGCIFSPGS